ncbi:MAG: N-acetylmuramoyl-L-alanine amidase [Thermonemataceae bacterium]|nr:N-acetylmuramoyl-L-alanine amidase [Thermonemataceae bacterium]
MKPIIEKTNTFLPEIPRRNALLYNLLATIGYWDIKRFQKNNNLLPDGIFGSKSWNMLYSKLLKVQPINFEGYYYKVEQNKKQIVWHHSAGSDNAENMFEWWKRDNVNHVATCIGIEKSGRVVKGFDEGYWAHHIGMSNAYNLIRNQESIAVELTNWGNLRDFSTWAGNKIDEKNAIELNYKGSKFYEAYTDAQIKALELWTLLVALRFDIPLTYSEKDMWEVSSNAIQGKAGIYTHNSFISWKTDVSPQPKLIKMAKNLVDFEKS